MAVPVALSMRRWGARRTQLVLGGCTSTLTLCTPWLLARLPLGAFLTLRLLQGGALANLYPLVGATVRAWAPAQERGLFVAVLTGYLQLSCVIAFPLAGLLVRFGESLMYALTS